MKTTAKIICLGISLLTLAFSQQAKALPPYFQTARWADGSEVDSTAIGNRIPLILIHGIQEPSTIWTAYLNYWSNSPSLRSQFKPYEFGYYTDNPDITSTDPTSVYQLGQDLGGFLQNGQSYGLNGSSVVILAHSMGGLVARSMMANYFFQDHTKGDSKVSLLITLATPHHGTPVANDYFMWVVGIPIIGQYSSTWFFNLNTGYAADLSWDAYDGRTFSFQGPDILSDAD